VELVESEVLFNQNVAAEMDAAAAALPEVGPEENARHVTRFH
jgi:hypothetical protein